MGKRVVIISDLHCGHYVGLTPTAWQSRPGQFGTKISLMQADLWEKYKELIDNYKPIDILIVNGDCIEGTGKRSGGSELITTDQNIQVEIASHCINYCEAKTVVMTYGTPYHVSDGGTDHERRIAEKVKASKIESHGFYNIEGKIFDVRHKPAGTSSMPHTKGTPLMREWLSNLMWHEIVAMQEKADILIRSHVHNWYQVENGSILAFTTPALQGFGSKFGARQCSNVVHWGLIAMDVSHKDVSWDRYLYTGEVLKTKAIVL